MKKILLFIFCGLVLLNFSCSKDDDESSEYISVLYNQTYCSDQWGYSKNKDELANKVRDYFNTENIEIFDVKFDDKGTAQLCNACTCLSGTRIIIKVNRNDLNSIKEYGFQE